MNLERINFLAAKSREEGLTDNEKVEQQKLRREYIDSVVGGLKCQLDNTYILDNKGNKTKLERKK